MANSIFDEDKELFSNFTNGIFEVEEYRELGYSIMTRLTQSSTTKKMLQDLIIANHYYLYVMEKVVEQGRLHKIKRAKLIRKQKKLKSKEQKEHCQ